MASFAEISAKMEKKYGDTEKEKMIHQEQTRQNSTASAVSKFNAISTRLDNKYSSGYSRVDETFINTFITDATNFFTQSQMDWEGRTWKSGIDQSKAQTRRNAWNDLSSRANAIRKYADANKGSMGTEAYNELVSYLDGVTSTGSSLLHGFYKQGRYYSQWDSEDAWIKGATENWQQRQKRYEDNTQRIAELEAEKESMGFVFPWFDKDWDRKSEIDAEIKRLQTENNLYERGEGGWRSKELDDSYKVTQADDFATTSANRDYEYPKMDEYILEQTPGYLDQNAWYWEDGVLYNAQGEAQETDEFGNWIDPRNKDRVVEDKLGLFLSATEKQRQRAAAGDWGINNVQSVFLEGLERDWTYLKPTEVDIYYYFLAESQEKAYQYLADMELELNRRRTLDEIGKWRAEYDEANFLEKAIMNVETVPAKFLSTIGGTVNNASNIVQGKDINPYSTAHTGMHYSQTIRGNTAEELNKTGIKLPVINFTLGDIYQTGMSRLDSALATKIFGGGGVIFLGMGAAQEEAYRLYKKGASAEQITVGSFAAGAAEAIWEYISFGKLKEIKDVSNPGEWVKSVLIQGWNEAEEEAITEVTNIVTNALVMGSQSDLAELYLENEKKAFETFKDILTQVTHSAFGGFLGGFGAGSIQSGRAYINTKLQHQNTGRQIVDRGNVGVLQEEATQDMNSVAPGQNVTDDVLYRDSVAGVMRQNNITAGPQSVDVRNTNVTDLLEPAEQRRVNSQALGSEQGLSQRENVNGGNLDVQNIAVQTATPDGVGEGVSDGGKKRPAGTGTGKQIGGLAERTEGGRSSWAEHARAIVHRQAAGKNLQKVSSKFLGLVRGTDTANVRVLPRESWDAAMQQTAQRVYQETGLEVTYVLGKLQIRGNPDPEKGTPGSITKVRGVITDSGIIIQADNREATIDQIADHEVYHYKADDIPALNWNIKNYILENFTEEEFSAALKKYVEAYRGIIDFGNEEDGTISEESLRQIEEELFADAYAGINFFGAHADMFTEKVNERMDNNWVGKKQLSDNGVRETTGPPAGSTTNIDEKLKERYSYSIEELGLRGDPKNMPRTPRDWHAFNRSFANKTSDIKEGETRGILIFTANDVYWVSADGYMQGFVETKVRITEKNRMYIDLLGDIINESDSNRQTISRRAEIIRNVKRGNYRDFVDFKDRTQKESVVGLYDRESTGNITGDFEYDDGNNEEELDYDNLVPGSLAYDGQGNAFRVDEDGAFVPIQLDQSDEISYQADNEIVKEHYSVDPDENAEQMGEDSAEVVSDVQSAYEGKTLSQDGDIYTYDFLTSLPDMQAVQLPDVANITDASGKVDKVKVIDLGIKNALSVGFERDGRVFVKNSYTGNNLFINAKAVRHGLEGNINRLLTNGRLGSVIGEVVKNAVPINALYDKAKGVTGTYALAGYATDNIGREFVAVVTVEQYTGKISGIDTYDVTHSISGRQKRGKRVDTKSQGFYPSANASRISIQDFLSVVKETHQSILSEDVLSHLGLSRNPAGYYYGRAKFSVDPDVDDTQGMDNTSQKEKKSGNGTQTEVAQKALRKTLMQEFEIPEGDEARLQEVIAQYTKEAKRKAPARTKTPKVDKPVAETKAITAKNDLRKTVISLFSIPEGQKAELGAVIDQYAERLIKNGELTEHDRKAFFDRMYAAGVMTVPAEEYKTLGRNHIYKGKIYVNPHIRADFGNDWNDIRRRAFSAGVYLTNDKSAAGVDAWNAELAEILPELFDSEELDMRSALERIVQIAEEGKDEKVGLAEYTARLAEIQHVPESEFLDNMERQLDWALRTFAEKAQLEMKLRQRTGIQMARERARHKEMSERQREQKELRELQQKTLKQLQWLSKNRFRAPEELQETWDEVLGDLDVFAVGAANEMNWSDKYNATWRDLAQIYKDAQKNDPNFMPSKELERIVGRLDADKIADLDFGALQDLYKAAIGLRTEFYNRNNVINDEMQRLFSEVYSDSKLEIESAPGGYSGNLIDRFMNFDQLTSMNVLQRMAGWNPDGAFYSMAKQLENGERDMRAYTVKANRMLEEFLTEHEAWVRKADGQGKDAVWYEIEVPELLQLGMGDKPIFGDAVKVYMTPAQKVHLYLESKNIDNLRHMTGGRTFVDKELYSKGKRQEAFAQGKTVRLAPETVKKIVSDLTEEETELAQVLERYYNTYATGEINRVSNILYGYDKAMGKNYAPIYTNKNYVQSEIGVYDTTAEGVGNLKGRQYAVNPTYNIGAFDAFERHVDQTARFVGMAIPARNWQTLLNWRTKNNSTGDVITHKWGEKGKQYVVDLITVLQGGKSEKKTSASKMPDWLLSNYIAATFGLNPSIVLKQMGSIPLASAYLGGTNLPSVAQVARIDRELISKYSQDLTWRTMGYSMPETKFLKDNPNWTQRNKFLGFVLGGDAITAMDGWAASVLWPWAENKVRKNNPDLQVGTQAQIDSGESPFYREVAKEFEYAMVRSQSVSDEMHQSSIRKDKSLGARAFTMFKSDSAQIYNAIRQKVGEAQYYAKSGADKAKVKEAKKAAGAVVLSAISGFVWAEAIDFLMNLWKQKGKKYRDEDDELTVASILEEVGMGMIGNMAGVVVYGEEIAEIIGNLISGEKWYGIDTPGLGQLTDMIESISDTGKALGKIIAGAVELAQGGGDVGEYFRQNTPDILGCVKEIAATAATYLKGVPVNNLEAYLLGLIKWVAPGLETAYQDAFAKADKSGLTGLTGSALLERIGNILDNRGVEAKDSTEKVLANLYESGYSKAVPSDIPGSVTVEGEKRELNEYQKQTYGVVWNEAVSGALDALVTSSAFKKADAELQAKMLSDLYTYATENAKAELFSEYEKGTIAKVKASGSSLAEYIAWRGATSHLKQSEKMADLAKQSMSDALKTEIIGTLIGTETKTADGNPTAWAKFQNAVKAGMDVDEFLEVYAAGGDVDKFMDFTDAGVISDDALELTQELAGLEPEEGSERVTNTQRWRAVVESVDGAEDQIEALSVIMTEGQHQKVKIAWDYDVNPSVYVALYEKLPDYDANVNGSYSNAEVKAAIDGFDHSLTMAQKGALWQLITGSKSAKNNPYSFTAGQGVINARDSADDNQSLSFSEEVARQFL